MVTLSEITDVKGEAGNFEVDILQQPRYVDESKCVGCGACEEKCPKKVSDRYNAGLSNRKAIYVEYAQAVPLKYAIDPDECIYLQKGKCGNCKDVCPADAIDYEQKEIKKTLNVGSIILSSGFTPFDPSKFDNYQYAMYPNVVTSMEFERILSASGPTHGHVLTRPKSSKKKDAENVKAPKKIAWLQCVGSRDMNRCDNAHCSSVCCMYAIKEAVIAKEHVGDDLDCTIFFMDMRTHGKDFERYYDAAREKHGIRFERSRIHTITEVPGTNDLSVRYANEKGELRNEVFDMIVLSIGLESSKQNIALANKLGLDLTPQNFCKTSTFEPVATSREGIFVCGAFQGPKDIPQSVVDASAAADAAGAILAQARNTLTRSPEVVPETNVIGERPRIGVFVCRCGSNIAGIVDVVAVAEYASKLPYVEFSTDNLYACSQDTQDNMVQLIKEKNLNRIVVAACTPKTHEPLFQETLLNSGLNKYLFEMANIRNHDSWVHKNNPELATNKAKDLVRSAVSKVALAAPLAEAELEVNQTAMVIGGGISGITTAKSLAMQGFHTHLIERSGQLGGQALNLYHTASNEDVQEKLSAMIQDIEQNKKITIHLNTELSSVEGFVGNFKTTLSSKRKKKVLEHGVAVIATGAVPFQPNEYCFGQDSRIITSLDLDKKFMDNDPILQDLVNAVFIQCVGSREPDHPYCSRVCCTHSVHNALELKKRNPKMNVYILYRDIRTYGEREILYKEARAAGVIFIRYSVNQKPGVVLSDGKILVTATDHVLDRPVEIEADLLTLASSIIPYKDEKLAKFFKVPMNDDGFFVERHAKLGPSEFATAGVFLCGLAHYPKPIDESIAQGQAAASRSVTLLSQKTIHTSGTVAKVNPAICSSCGVCLSICPYSAPSFLDAKARMFRGKAQINPVLCKGCGLCVASCRSGALHLQGFDNDQIFSQIFALSEAG
ncbi:MAG: heterodisulfide reductase [Desulfobacterium sp.]|nr:heterodisulfide reductase [Desulfobacterium sp.]